MEKGKGLAYHLSCGYVINATSPKTGKKKELYKEGGCYHVRYFDKAGSKWTTWETFETLTDAQKYYRSIDIESKKMPQKLEYMKKTEL